MLVSYSSMPPTMILLLLRVVMMMVRLLLMGVVVLLGLSVMLLLCRMLKFSGHVHLHVPLMTRPSIHHDLMALLVSLAEHSVRIVT